MEGLARGYSRGARRVFKVSELNRALKGLIEEVYPFLWVEGEIANLKCSRAGHLYFSLRDDGASLRAVLFRTFQPTIPFALEDGMHVLCFGRLSVYEARGEYQLLVQQVEPVGLGAYRLALAQLKEKLAKEGLLSEDLKRPLPFFPKAVGLITSLHGAAVHDFLRIALSKNPKARIFIYPVRVQGPEAAAEICQGLEVLSGHQDVEVIVIARGGGSLEDLWAFNEEGLARAIRACRVPVVSAVGHEIDYTVCDLVADARAPTPTAAADLVFPNLSALEEGLNLLGERLKTAVLRKISAQRERLSFLASRLKDPQEGLKEKQRELMLLERRLKLALQNLLARKREELKRLSAHLEAVSPLSVLARGYSLVYRLPARTLVKRAEDVEVGEEIEISLAQGKIRAKVQGKEA